MGPFHLRGSSVDWCQDVPAAVAYAAELAEKSERKVIIDASECAYDVRHLFGKMPRLVEFGNDNGEDDAILLKGYARFPPLNHVKNHIVEKEEPFDPSPFGVSRSLPYSFRLLSSVHEVRE